MNTTAIVSPLHAAAVAAGADATVTSTTTETIEVSTPGLFGRMARAMNRHPIATSVGVSLGTTAGIVGAVSYRQTGSVVPGFLSPNDAGDIASAVVGLFAGR